tara:strand:+ start:253 stop:537 length:285 start_codon:yes stop_codon:yes gene_type:complete
MTKDKIENQLNIIWQTWLVAEDKKNRLSFDYDEKFLVKFNMDYNTEMFLSAYDEKLSSHQKEFANNIMQTMVEIQNHDNIPSSLFNVYPSKERN